MATSRPDEEEKLNDAVMNVVQPCLESEDDGEGLEDQNWDDWEEDDTAEEQSSSPEWRCLFCDSTYNSSGSLFEHCASAHLFDFYGIKKTHGLDFYSCFKLINYVRSQVAANKCWRCAKMCFSMEELQNHLHEDCSLGGSILPWDDERYLNPFLQDDALLYSFDEGDESEDADSLTIDSKELGIHLSQFEHLNTADLGSSNRYASELISPCENGVKEAELAFDKGTLTEKFLGRSTVNDSSRIADGLSPSVNVENKKDMISSSMIAENEIMNINKNYFGSYSSFGIHRDMINDKVRTDAYRKAIMENPSLIRGAVVMDVGCGTGILSLFAAQAGAARVIAVEASNKMAEVATEIAKDNNLLQSGIPGCNQGNAVIEVVQGMVEELGNADHIKPLSVDVLLSEWMGYCLLYESMLISVLFARDRWLKPGGAILPDTATMYVAGFGRGATSIPFWENVYGFNMSCIGREVVEDATRVPIVDVVNSCNIVTTTKVLQTFDLATMQPKQMDFTSVVELEPKLDAPSSKHPTSSNLEITWCYGVVLWFETGFTERFCSEKPVILTTSPYDPSTHWSQTILTFREPIAIASDVGGPKLGAVGTYDCPAVRILSRISIVRAAQHRSIDISLELTGVGPDGRKHSWPVQMFNLK